MNAVTTITHLAHIDCPDALRDIPGWLIWRYEPNENPGGKPRKVPSYANGGRRAGEHGSPKDRDQLVTFDAARAAAARRGMDGVGFAPLDDFGIVALDFDNCVNAGDIHPDVLDLLGTSYAEFSPSGNGIRAFFKGQLGNLKDHGEPFGFEVFSSKGYVTFTGNVLDITRIVGNENTVAPVDDAVMGLFRKRFSNVEERAERTSNEPLGLTRSQIDQCLEVLPKGLDYDKWVQVGMALHHEMGGTREAFEIWDTWSQQSPKYTARQYGLDRWRSFGKGGQVKVTARSLVKMANEQGAHIVLNGPASAEEFDAVGDESSAAESDKPAKPQRFPVIPMGEFTARPAPNWIIKGVLPKAGLVVLYGESGSGKSFVALDMAACIALGRPWRERRVRQGRVVYIAAEGAGGFRNRSVALCQHLGIQPVDLPLDVIADAPNLLQKDDALDVARSIGRADVVVIDTFAQVTPGANENAGEDMGKALAHCAGIHRATGATVLLVHHSGKDASKGARGWSGIKAAADAELEVTKTPAGRALRTSKMKDGDDSLSWGFGLDIVTIGVDEDGDPITSCVVTEQATPEVAAVRRKMGPIEAIVDQVIREFAAAQSTGIEVEEVLREAVRRMPEAENGARDTRRMRARRALMGMCEGGDAPYWIEDGCITVM